MKHVIEHDLGVDLAVKACHAAIKSYSKKFAKYDPRATWKSDTHCVIKFRAKLVTLEGAVDVKEDRIEADLDVPLVFRVFRERALKLIEREVREWIAKAKAGELD
jgi:hypothetical protein